MLQRGEIYLAKPLQKIKANLIPGQTALISGGSSGIGLATAKILASKGLHIWIVARREKLLRSAVSEIEKYRENDLQQIGMIPADITDLDQVLETVASVEDTTGCPDLLINSAGVTQPGYVQDHDLDVFKWMMDVNYFGTVNMIRAVLLGMIDRGSGYIVNISSMAGFIGAFGYAAYGASKYAVRGLSDVLRTELKPLDIGISIVFPPDTDTPQLAYENEFKPFETKYLTGIPNERSPDEVAEAIVKGISQGDYLIFPSFDTRLWFKINNLLGAGVYPIMDILVNNARRKKDNQEKG